MGGETHGVGWGQRNYHPGQLSESIYLPIAYVTFPTVNQHSPCRVLLTLLSPSILFSLLHD